MRLVVQRVSRAAVRVGGRTVAEIGEGLLVLVGVATGDGGEAARALARKVAGLRIFEDSGGKMNLSLLETGGQALVVPQFTLLGDVSRGRRPSWSGAAPPEEAAPLVEAFAAGLAQAGVPVARGAFREHMEVELVNDGPVTLILEG